MLRSVMDRRCQCCYGLAISVLVEHALAEAKRGLAGGLAATNRRLP
jgi:hypothetical protein